MSEYYAHSENSRNERHSLSKHLHQTAKYAETFAWHENYKTIFKITGLLHDLGKYQPEFQRYLIYGGRRGSIPHAAWGAGYARLCKILEASIAIDGHHKGLPDNSLWKQKDTEPFIRGEISGFDSVVKAFIVDTGINETDIQKPDSFAFSKSQREVFIRYLYSSLTDSDWLSTEEHFERDKFNMRIRANLQPDLMIDKLEEVFSQKSKEGEINHLRNDARNKALQKSDLPCGFYSLALPTGMGKTLTSMAWALRHAKENDLKRIIIVLPYILTGPY